MNSAPNCRSRDDSSERAAPRARGAARVRHLPLALALLLSACASAHQGSAPATAPPRPSWPPPPSPPRVELESGFRRASDLGIERSLWRRVADLVSGGGELDLVRPAGVAATGTRIAVADPGAGVVHVYDLAAQRFTALRGCGDEPFAEPVAVALLDDDLYVSDAAAARVDVFRRNGECAAAWPLPAGSRPAGLAADSGRHRLYVADSGAHRVLAYDATGTVVLELGRRGSGRGEFNYPTWLAVDDGGRLYVTDALNFRVQSFDAAGTPLASFGQHGDGSGDFASPKGIGVAGADAVFVVDALFDAVQIFDGDGRYLMVFGARGREPGHFWLPSGLAVAGDRIYVADSYNRRVQVFRLLEERP
jgi:DNA-binding beta-propeller fold protein YncE